VGLEKAKITNTVTNKWIAVMFNPEEYTQTRENTFAAIGVPGRSAPIVQFVYGNQQSLEMELFLDTYEAHQICTRPLNQAGDDVRKLVRSVTDLMNIDPTTHAPPVLFFTWASLSFRCVLTRVTQRFIMFKPDGTPVRARLNVTFSQYSNAEQEAKEVKRETADYTKVHVVAQGETLSTIAYACYGNPRLWRPIALRNRIDDPRRLEVGVPLAIPQLPYRDPDSGEVFQ
jgi:hypothetical protein